MKEVYVFPEGFEWDVKKSAATKVNRGVDFLFATQAWLDEDSLEFPSTTEDEQRVVRISCIDTKIFAIVFTQRDENIRLISIRRARKKEINLYEENK